MKVGGKPYRFPPTFLYLFYLGQTHRFAPTLLPLFLEQLYRQVAFVACGLYLIAWQYVAGGANYAGGVVV